MKRFVLLCAILLIVSNILEAGYTLPADNPNDGARVGLVLSGGGAKGLAHISILKLLEDVNMPIDYIGGTSMGSIVGGLYAIGYNAREIEQIVIDENWSRLFDDRVNRWLIPIEEKQWDSRYMVTLPIEDFRVGLPRGVIGGQQIGKMLSRLTAHAHDIRDFNSFPIPFVAIATNLEDGSAIVLREGVLPDVLRASMSIPSIFAPVEINGKRAIDGGVARNFPVIDVLEMGADFVIGVNASTGTNEPDSTQNSMLSVLNQAVFFHIVQTTQNQARLVDYMMQPEIGDFGMMDFDDVAKILASADSYVEQYREELQNIADSLNAMRSDPGKRHRFTIDRKDRVIIEDIKLYNTGNLNSAILMAELQLVFGNEYSIAEIETAVDRVYGLPFYDRVNYTLEQLESGNYRIHMTFSESNLDVFNVGMRYDNRKKASIILSTRFRNPYRNNATLRMSLRLGEEPMGDIQYFYYLGWKPKLGVNLQANYTSLRNDIYDLNNGIQSTVVTDALFGEFWTGPVLSSYVIMGVGFRSEAFNPSRVVGISDLETNWQYINRPFAFIWYDTKDAVDFTRRGQEIRMDATRSLNWFSNNRVFSQYRFEWSFFVPIEDRLTLTNRVFSSVSTENYPVHYRQDLGGVPGFAGFYIGEIHDDWVASAQTGIQAEIASNRFIKLFSNVGRASEWGNTDFNENPVLVGWGVSGGINSVVGPVVVTFSGSKRNPIMYDIRVGFNF